MARREYTGVYPYTLAGDRILYRTLFTDSNGVQRQKRGFRTPTAAAKFRTEMIARADLESYWSNRPAEDCGCGYY